MLGRTATGAQGCLDGAPVRELGEQRIRTLIVDAERSIGVLRSLVNRLREEMSEEAAAPD